MVNFDVNDYELIYLYRDGNENAYMLLFQKYGFLIRKVVWEVWHYRNDKYHDLIQEGYLVLEDCLKRFNQDCGVSFYSYFYICLTRMISKIVKTDYYDSPLLLETLDYFPAEDNRAQLMKYAKIFDDYLAKEMYVFCFIDNQPVSAFSRKYNVSYHRALKISEYVEANLKNLLTN